MRLLRIDSGQLYTFAFPPPVPYAILSHTWSSPSDYESTRYGSDDNTVPHPGSGESGLCGVVERFCQLARAQHYEFVWVDAVCVVKSCSADVSETINSLPSYFRGASVCFAFLSDLACGSQLPCRDSWARCRFWDRSWTLQELVLPSTVQFYDRRWHLRGERSSHPLPSLISEITGIDAEVLAHRRSLQEISVARRMSWAAGRGAARPEDTAYSLLGLFDVHVPIVYGEGQQRAFRRVQEEILKYNNDMSLFAWTRAGDGDGDDERRGMFASSPGEFATFGRTAAAREPFVFEGFMALTSRGVLVNGQVFRQGNDFFLDLGAQADDEDDDTDRRGILLRKRPDGIFERVASDRIHTSSAAVKTAVTQFIACRGNIDSIGLASAPVVTPDSCQDEKPQTRPSGSSSLPISLKTPSTPSDEQSDADMSMPVRSSNGISCASGKDDLGWVELVRDSREETETDDDSEGEYGSMKTSQQTEMDCGWELSLSTTTMDPPPRTGYESPAYVHDRAGQADAEESDAVSCPADPVPKTDALVDNDKLGSRLASVMLGKFSISQENETRALGKRTRRIKRSRGPVSPAANSRKRRGLGGSDSVEFTCPFFKKDPKRYVKCLKDHELRTARHVKNHLLRAHRLPCHCPACNTSFASAAERDQHVIHRTCGLAQKKLLYDGVSEKERDLLLRIPESASGEVQWFAMWEILFPDDGRPKSPYFRSELGLKVSRFRSFWHEHGEKLLKVCLVEYLPVDSLPVEPQVIQDLSTEVFSEATTPT